MVFAFCTFREPKATLICIHLNYLITLLNINVFGQIFGDQNEDFLHLYGHILALKKENNISTLYLCNFITL